MRIGDFSGLCPVERIQSPEIDQPSHNDKEIAMSCPSIAIKLGHNAELLQMSNDMLHEDTGFVDNVIVEFLKQGQWVIALCAFGLVDFIIWVAVFKPRHLTTKILILAEHWALTNTLCSAIIAVILPIHANGGSCRKKISSVRHG